MHILTQLISIISFFTHSLKSSNPEVNEMSEQRLCEELSNIENKAAELMKSTPPNGKTHYTTLKWVLEEREMI